MPVNGTFGKRNFGHSAKSPGSVSAARLSTNASSVGADAPSAIPRAAHGKQPPLVTGGLITLLCLIFWAEIAQTADFASALSPSRQSLIMLGGVDGKLIFGDPVPPLAMAGMVLIVGGVVLVGLSGAKTH